MANLNNISNPNRIYVGQVLKLSANSNTASSALQATTEFMLVKLLTLVLQATQAIIMQQAHQATVVPTPSKLVTPFPQLLLDTE